MTFKTAYFKSFIIYSEEWWIVKLRANALCLSDLCKLPPKKDEDKPRNTFKSISGMINGSNAGILSSGIPKKKE